MQHDSMSIRASPGMGSTWSACIGLTRCCSGITLVKPVRMVKHWLSCSSALFWPAVWELFSQMRPGQACCPVHLSEGWATPGSCLQQKAAAPAALADVDRGSILQGLQA